MAVDTEFLREKTYYANLCLMQLQINGEELCIDIIKAQQESQLIELAEVFTNPDLVKVFHASRQDIEVILTSMGVLTTPIFDTQLAAAFCGSDMQIGYSALVQQELDVSLPKSQARTDWSRRPLSEQQIEYALNDVRYLFDLQDIFSERMDSQNKLQWFEQEQALSYDQTLYEVEPEQAFKRLSGGNLSLVQQLVLRDIATWRETLAIKKDLPRSWILKDRMCYDIADKVGGSIEKTIQRIDALENGLGRFRSDILEIISNAQAKANQNTERLWSRVEPLNKFEKSLCSSMMKIVRDTADELQVAQGLLATRKDIESLYRQRSSNKLLKGWRKDTVGERLLDYLNSAA